MKEMQVGEKVRITSHSVQVLSQLEACRLCSTILIAKIQVYIRPDRNKRRSLIDIVPRNRSFCRGM